MLTALVGQGEHTRVLAENADGDSSRRVRAVMLFIASIGEEVRASCSSYMRFALAAKLGALRRPRRLRRVFLAATGSSASI